MIEQAQRIEREFHVGPDGDRWTLVRSLDTNQPFVLHRPCENASEVELDLGSFLVLFKGPERDDLMRLIASLLPDDQPDASAGTAVRSVRLISRWMPRAKT